MGVAAVAGIDEVHPLSDFLMCVTEIVGRTRTVTVRALVARMLGGAGYVASPGRTTIPIAF